MSLHDIIPFVSVPEGVSGEWRVERFTLTEQDAKRFNIFSTGRHVSAGTFTRLMRGPQIVMSDTPAEKRDHWQAVNHARGHCLVNGLGIGMVLNAMLRKPGVEHVTVIEASADVIALTGPTYSGDRVTIVHDSAFDYKPPLGVRYGAVWHDIWDAICSENLSEMATLHRRYGRRCDWQGSWGRDECERLRRQDRNWR